MLNRWVRTVTSTVGRGGHRVGQIIKTLLLSLLNSPFLLRPMMLRAGDGYALAMMSVLVALLLTIRTRARSRAALQLEVLALRHQLHVLQRSRHRRLQLAPPDRWL